MDAFWRFCLHIRGSPSALQIRALRVDLWDVVLFVLVNTVALVVQVGKPCLITPTLGAQHHPTLGRWAL